MPDNITDKTVAPQVELAVRRLESISTLPCTAARFLSQINQTQLSSSDLVDIIDSDPALATKVLSLIHHEGLSFSDEDFSFGQVLDKLSLRTVRDAVLSVGVYQPFEQDEHRTLFRKQLVLHSLAVACCARSIAEIISPQMASQFVYLAGLLHNIGILALDQAMPRGFAGIVEEARSQKVLSCDIEQKHLGVDHTILGKRLAQKWHLPNQITLAIWLHHSDTVAISKSMPEARIAQVVQLADVIARQCGIGQSGSYDSPDLPASITQSLGIAPEQMEQIRQNLPEAVEQKSKVLGLDLPNAVNNYCDIVHTTAAQMARNNTELSLENRELRTASTSFNFATEFLLSTNPNIAPIEAAENFATRWQKFYQTGPVCVYLTPASHLQILEGVVVESSSEVKMVYLKVPSETSAIPEAIAKSFAILNAQDSVDWLFEQLNADFELSKTKVAPLLCSGKAVGVIVFELRYPVGTDKLEAGFRIATSIAGAALGLAYGAQSQQQLSENLVRLVTSPKAAQPEPKPESRPLAEPVATNILDALAEMAAGAAHELNNPLSVISGRAQLLAGTETDPEKKRMLEQIRKNTRELSAVIDDLMSFAQPPQPKASQTDVRQMLDEATQFASQKAKAEHINVQTKVAETVENVFVDSGHIVSAIANILCNCLESYTDQLGPIQITADSDQTSGMVRIQIKDLGCGMDTETLRKATYPFFSARPAGRKRGMGLAHAARLIELNKGSLQIQSQLDEGSTVTILLPSGK